MFGRDLDNEEHCIIRAIQHLRGEKVGGSRFQVQLEGICLDAEKPDTLRELSNKSSRTVKAAFDLS